MDVVIIGAGQAAAQLAVSLRQEGFAARYVSWATSAICLISARRYRRSFCTSAARPNPVPAGLPSFWQDHEVSLVLGTRLSTSICGSDAWAARRP